MTLRTVLQTFKELEKVFIKILTLSQKSLDSCQGMFYNISKSNVVSKSKEKENRDDLPR